MYVINFDKYKSMRTHWIPLNVIDNNVIHFGSFVVEHILKGIKKFIGNKNIMTNIYRIQTYDSIM